MPSSDDGTVKEPINREPDMSHLVQSFLTPSESQPSKTADDTQVAYDRNHGPIQHIDPLAHKLTIKSEATTISVDLVLSVDDLKTKFRQHTVQCALQCAGNRRHEMRSRVKEVSGIDWGDGAVMNAEWTGPLLRDVLIHAGLSPKTMHEGLHVQMECNATEVQDDEWYGSSVPLDVVMDEEREVVLALEMNDTPLPDRHGGPVRSVIPGIIGARSVKWLDTIVLSSRESQNHYQQHDYKVLPPEATSPEKAEELGLWDKTPAMQDNPINSVVAVPGEDGETLVRRDDGKVRIAGYAIPKGKDGPVVRVQVSIDRGGSWYDATIMDGGDEHTTHPANRGKPRGKFSWVLWEVYVPAEPAEGVDIWSKATDRGGNTMSEVKGTWNLRGVGYNALEGRVGIKID
ncbi:sulfite oxidase [Exophiala viscosa]|uniref:sulfite oxidase n=1 Tax=Exophiala viscosa TaxID=2486360 RepID=UPI002196D625|nr:sulfite oxidase [Exophiala viscosa]